MSENGRTWSPITYRPPTLTFGAAATAETDDGANTTEWQAVVEATGISWKEGMSTAAGEPETSFQVGGSVAAALINRTTWSVDGGRLVINGAHAITLAYGADRPSPPSQVSGVGVFLNAGHAPQPGELDHSLSGHVVVRDAAHAVVAELNVTPYDDGETQLSPGKYDVTGTVEAGACTPSSAVASSGGIAEVTLACPTQ